MASGPSTAYLSFRKALMQASSLMQLEKRMQDPPPPHEQSIQEGLRGGAVVLMVAAFEAFLRDVFEERIDALSSRRRPVTFPKLPVKMRVAAVFNPLERAIRGLPGQPSERVERIRDVQAAAKHVAGNALPGWAFAVTGGNADPATVKRLFDEVGRQKVLERALPRFEKLWRAPVPRTFLRDKLAAIVRARHEVAHGANVLGWSRQDLMEAERFLRLFAKTLDDDLRIHLNRVG